MALIKTISSALLLSGMLLGPSAFAISVLDCATTRAERLFPQGGSEWKVLADITSQYSLAHVDISNVNKPKQGSVTRKIYSDSRITDSSVFQLDGDDDCQYDLVLPKNFGNQRRFDAELNLTCEGEFDSVVAMECVQRAF